MQQGEEIVITVRGKTIARIISDHPASKPDAALKRLESLRGSVIVGDILGRLVNSGRAALTISEPTTNMLVISKAENNNSEKGKNMNIRIKKYLLVGFLVLFFGAATPVAAVTETQIVLTTEATNDAIVNLEAALKAVTENRLDEAQNYVDATRSSASDILGRCSVEAKKERGSNALKNARREIKNGDSGAAEASLKEAIKIFKSLLMSVNNTAQPSLFK